VLVLGFDALGAGHAALHDMTVTRPFYERLPSGARSPSLPRGERLESILQKCEIEGLPMAGQA
jgi:hypothetical protein